MSSKRYPEEFKVEAVKQVTEKGHSVADLKNELHQAHPHFGCFKIIRSIL